MDGKNGLRLWGDGLLDEFRIQAIGIGINVNENRYRIYQQYRSDCAFPGVGRDNHFVPWTNVDSLERCLNGYSARVHTLAVLGGVEFGKLLGERVGVLARKWLSTPVVIFENIFERFLLFIGENWPRIKALFSERLSAGNC